MMTDAPYITRLNIAHFRASLKLEMDNNKRSIIERLLAEASEALAMTAESDTDQRRYG